MDRAFAEGGPLGGRLNLTVERGERGHSGGWPAEVVWTSGPGSEERHLYRFKLVSMGPSGGSPVYEFVRTLAADEQLR